MQPQHEQRRYSTLSYYPAHRIAKKAAIVCGVGIVAHWLYGQGENDWYHLRTYTNAGLFILVWLACLRFLEFTQELRLHRYQIRLNDIKNDPPRREYHGHWLSDAELEKLGAFDPNQGQLVGKTASGRPIFLPSTHSVMVSKQGSGKTISRVIPILLHGHRQFDPKTGKSRAASALVMDVKGELHAVTARHRRDHFKQAIYVINPERADTHAYNPLDLVLDALNDENEPDQQQRNRLANRYAHKIAVIIKPPPPAEGKNDPFWRDGVLTLIEFSILYVCLVEHKTPKNYTLMRVGELLYNDDLFKEAIQTAKTSPAFNNRLADLGHTIGAMNKYLETHSLSARLDWSMFTEAGIFANCFRRSDFRFYEMKHRPMTVYLQGGRADKNILKKAYSLLSDCFITEICSERAKAGSFPVNALLEEATNVAFDLSHSLTLLRSTGVRVDIIAQSIFDLYTNFTVNATKTTWGNTEVRIVDGGTNDPEIADLVSKAVGDSPYYKISFNIKNPFEAITHTESIEEQPLLKSNTIATMSERVVLWDKGNILCYKATYNEFNPWYIWSDPNPEERGRKLPKVSNFNLVYDRPDRNGWQHIRLVYYNAVKPPPRRIARLRDHIYRTSWLYVTGLYCGALVFLYNIEAITGTTPHVLYGYNTTYGGSYTQCDYIGINSRVTLRSPQHCPLLHLLEPLPAYFSGGSGLWRLSP